MADFYISDSLRRTTSRRSQPITWTFIIVRLHFDARGTKVKVDNLHYELTQEDLEGLFGKIGDVTKVELLYDRAGRSEGTAYVTYNRSDDARRLFANLTAPTQRTWEINSLYSTGQPIRLSIMPSAPRRNPFDSAYMPGRSLADRITVPGGRSRSLSPNRYSNRDRDVDRYVPGGRSGGRSRSPMHRNRRGGDGRGGDRGRRPGARREAREKEDRDGGERKARGRPKKTAEELDAEMADYFGPGEHATSAPADIAPATDAPALDDIDMIE
ncbi:RNA binding domain-containing protein [Apiospora hydei]|uniref:RNA binding domain-containing protein n=1 Tax=Apiospora hydei TaxID=1337664 RepID=A0ABR1WYK9_9PEZI